MYPRPEEILQRLRNREDNFTERKPESVKDRDVLITLVAFANSVPDGRTAILYIGVSDDGRIIGVASPEGQQRRVDEIRSRRCYPAIDLRTEILLVEERSVVAVVIPSHMRSGPFFAGPAYTRQGSSSVIASETVFDEMIANRLSKPHEILKWKDKIITFVPPPVKITYAALGRSPLALREHHERRVETCNAHYVTLYDIASGRISSEPLDDLILSHDHKRNRLMLSVRRRE